ncbi:MAG: hypothetical protein F6K47_22920 [Symploca sp. SIO2E6]|nr:hypothetical protein [Symploca sp. SIO2E6]
MVRKRRYWWAQALRPYQNEYYSNVAGIDITMLKNITLSAEQQLIELARNKATRENSTLNAQFHDWLERYVSTEHQLIDYDLLMEQ